MKDLLYICNPIAGRGLGKSRLSEVISYYNKAGIMPRVFMTGPDRELSQALSGLSDDSMLVCAGGDGMLNIMLNELCSLGKDIPLGYIPFGTTNDFARSMGLPKKLSELVAASISDKILRMDTGELNGRRFIYVAGFGNFTDISYKTPAFSKNLLGYLAYILEGARSLADIKPFHVSIETEGEKLEGDYVLGLISNSRSVAGMKPPVSSETRLDDGLMELTLIRMPDSLKELRGLLESYITPDHRSELMEFRQGKSFDLTSEKLCWTLDGEFGGCYDRTHISVVPGSFSIRLPEGKADQKA